MKWEPKFYRCNVCGNLICLVEAGGGQLVCCGQNMQLLEANTVDAAQEKHVPVGTLEAAKLKVAVGSVAHPMLEEHHISWIAVVQNDKVQIKKLQTTGKPEAVFDVDSEGAISIYEYCNLHGLWKAEMPLA